jgi:hypothetical protein
LVIDALVGAAGFEPADLPMFSKVSFHYFRDNRPMRADAMALVSETAVSEAGAPLGLW